MADAHVAPCTVGRMCCGAPRVFAPWVQEAQRTESQMAQCKTEPEAGRPITDVMPSRKRRLQSTQNKQAEPMLAKTQPLTQTTQAAQAEPAAKRARHVSVSSNARTDHTEKREQEMEVTKV